MSVMQNFNSFTQEYAMTRIGEGNPLLTAGTAKRRRLCTVWSEDELRRLFALRAKGRKWREIGEELGHNTSSVSGAYKQHVGTWLIDHPEDERIIMRCLANAGAPKGSCVGGESSSLRMDTVGSAERAEECKSRLKAWGLAMPPTQTEREWLEDSLLELIAQ